MLKRKMAGWATINFAGHRDWVSYITNVLTDVLEAVHQYYDLGIENPVIRFDAEGYDLKFVLGKWESHLLVAGDRWDCYTSEKNIDEIFLELLSDISKDLHGWIYDFTLWDEETEKNLEQKEKEIKLFIVEKKKQIKERG